MSAKHTRLALFAASRPAGESWRERMEAWNQRYGRQGPRWRYSRETNFAQDCAQAQQRLLHPPYGLP